MTDGPLYTGHCTIVFLASSETAMKNACLHEIKYLNKNQKNNYRLKNRDEVNFRFD